MGAKLRCNLDTKTAMNYRTTKRAFIRVARLGFTTTYKHAGTRGLPNERKSYKTSRFVG
jgi:hypothetical protein